MTSITIDSRYSELKREITSHIVKEVKEKKHIFDIDSFVNEVAKKFEVHAEYAKLVLNSAIDRNLVKIIATRCPVNNVPRIIKAVVLYDNDKNADFVICARRYAKGLEGRNGDK